MLHNRFAGEVPFPQCGEGFVFRFRTIDLAELRSKYGFKFDKEPEYDEKGRLKEHFWTLLYTGLMTHDPVIYVDLIRAGLKRTGTATKVDPEKEGLFSLEDIPWAFEDIRIPLETALMCSRWGITPEQYAEILRKQVEDLQAEQGKGLANGAAVDPLSGPMTTSRRSSESSASAIDTGSRSKKAGSTRPSKSSATRKPGPTKRKAAASLSA